MPTRIIKFVYVGAVGNGETVVMFFKHNTQRKKTHGKFYPCVYVFDTLIKHVHNLLIHSSITGVY